MADIKEAAEKLTDALIRSHRMSHTSVVATSASILNIDLERCIKLRLRPLNKAMTRRLFGTYCPLSTFAAKIDVAYALDITTDAIHVKLSKIRKIRNLFAHSTSILSLDKEPIRPLFNSLARPPKTKGTYSEVFVACITSLDDFLENYMIRMGVTDGLSEKNTPKPII